MGYFVYTGAEQSEQGCQAIKSDPALINEQPVQQEMTPIPCDGQPLFEMLKLKDEHANDGTYKSIFACISGLHVLIEMLTKGFGLF